MGDRVQPFSPSVVQPFPSLRVRRQRLDKDAHGRVMVQRKSGAVDETQARGAAGYLGNEGGLAETHLPDALAKALVTRQFAHARGGARGELAERRQVFERAGHFAFETEYQDRTRKKPRVK